MMSVLIAPAPAVYARESWAEIIKSARMPQFIIPTIALPPAFYALFALAMGQGWCGWIASWACDGHDNAHVALCPCRGDVRGDC